MPDDESASSSDYMDAEDEHQLVDMILSDDEDMKFCGNDPEIIHPDDHEWTSTLHVLAFIPNAPGVTKSVTHAYLSF